MADKRARVLEFSPGTIIDNRYQVECLLGMGAIGKVYKVRHAVLNTVFAVKFVLPEAITEATLKRFRLEAQAVSLLKHPNIIGIHDYGVADGAPYIVMEYLEGQSLAQYLFNEGGLGRKLFYSIFQQVCAALQHAHEKGILHRDIKPANIFLCSNEESELPLVKLVDFGFAKVLTEQDEASRITLTGEVVGSPYYMSPEQCMGDELDLRTDIYSVAVVMYEALTGKPVFTGKNPVAIMQQHMQAVPRFPEDAAITPKLQELLLKCLSKDRKKRPESAADLGTRLAALCDEEKRALDIYSSVTEKAPLSFQSIFQKSGLSSMPASVLLIAFIMLLLLSAAVYFFLLRH